MAFFLGAALLMVMLDAGPGGDAIGTIEITDGKAEIAPVADERDARAQRLGLGRRIGNAALEVGESARVGGFLGVARSEEHTSELQSLMRISYAVFCLKKKKMSTARVIMILIN